MVWLPRWGCDGMIGSAQKLLMARAGVSVAAGGGGDITFVSGTGRASILGTTTLDLPSGLQPNDLVIVATMGDSDIPLVPTGYTTGQVGSDSSVGYMWSYKIMGDPVDTQATGLYSSGSMTHMAIAFRGDSGSAPLVAPFPAINVISNGMPDGPSVSASTDNMVVTLGYLDDSVIQSFVSEPTGYTFAAASSGSNSSVMSAYLKITSDGSYDPGPFTNHTTTQPSVGVTFVIY
mgnify:CR=1 FL=1